MSSASNPATHAGKEPTKHSSRNVTENVGVSGVLGGRETELETLGLPRTGGTMTGGWDTQIGDQRGH